MRTRTNAVVAIGTRAPSPAARDWNRDAQPLVRRDWDQDYEMGRRPMIITHDLERDATVVALPDAAFSSVQCSRQQLLREDLLQLAGRITTGRMILDLAEVRCFGAAFLGVLVLISRNLKARDRQLCVCGDSQNLIGLAQLDRLFPVYPTLQEALYGCGQRVDPMAPAGTNARSI